GYKFDDILNGINKGLDPLFFKSLKNLKNPYYKKFSSDIIVENLKKVTLNDKLIVKQFCDVK
ncbi:hypothetical protein MHK_003638, partial [Candidatus Magnetomorum sp. HK-1]